MRSRLILLTVTAVMATCLSSAEQAIAQADKQLSNSMGMKLVLIPKGTFRMGSPESEEGHEKNETHHEVTISENHYLGVTEVTQEQYKKVMGTNPSRFQGKKISGDSSNHPVEQVSWDDAVEFCKKLSDLPEEKKAGRVYRLPTEAEWEFACRAGSEKAFFFGEDRRDLADYAWFLNNSGDKEIDFAALLNRLKNNPRGYMDTLLSAGWATHPVGEKKPNAWGLHDMHGNVWEWCSDYYGDYPKGAVTDPVSSKKGSLRVFRGGSWDVEAAGCRSAFRLYGGPSSGGPNLGFRVALSSPEIPK